MALWRWRARRKDGTEREANGYSIGETAQRDIIALRLQHSDCESVITKLLILAAFECAFA